jgi:hypothetical protein
VGFSKRQGQTRTIATAVLVETVGFVTAAAAVDKRVVIRIVGRADDGPHDVVIPAIGIVGGDDDHGGAGLLPRFL